MKTHFHLSPSEADIILDMKQEKATDAYDCHQLTIHHLCTWNSTVMAKKIKFIYFYWKFLHSNLQPFRKCFLRYTE